MTTLIGATPSGEGMVTASSFMCKLLCHSKRVHTPIRFNRFIWELQAGLVLFTPLLYTSARLSPGHERAKKGEEAHMGRKSSGQDKGEGVVDKVKGRTKEADGAVTGDESKKSEGRSDRAKGTAKEKKGEAKDLLD